MQVPVESFLDARHIFQLRDSPDANLLAFILVSLWFGSHAWWFLCQKLTVICKIIKILHWIFPTTASQAQEDDVTLTDSLDLEGNFRVFPQNMAKAHGSIKTVKNKSKPKKKQKIELDDVLQLGGDKVLFIFVKTVVYKVILSNVKNDIQVIQHNSV